VHTVDGSERMAQGGPLLEGLVANLLMADRSTWAAAVIATSVSKRGYKLSVQTECYEPKRGPSRNSD
jgi:hypothetical protein